MTDPGQPPRVASSSLARPPDVAIRSVLTGGVADGDRPKELATMTECAVREFGPETHATLHRTGTFAAIPAAFEHLYGSLQRRGHSPRGMPIAVYLNDPATVAPEDAAWEVRTRIDDDAQETGPDADGFAVQRLPATLVAVTTHRGPYDQVAPAYERLTEWIDAHGFEVSGPPMEMYLNDPGTVPPDEYLTEILIPVFQRP
jgi:effector-binding domain-containing protein